MTVTEGKEYSTYLFLNYMKYFNALSWFDSRPIPNRGYILISINISFHFILIIIKLCDREWKLRDVRFMTIHLLSLLVGWQVRANYRCYLKYNTDHSSIGVLPVVTKHMPCFIIYRIYWYIPSTVYIFIYIWTLTY